MSHGVEWCGVVWCWEGGREGGGLWWMIFAHFIALFLCLEFSKRLEDALENKPTKGNSSPTKQKEVTKLMQCTVPVCCILPHLFYSYCTVGGYQSFETVEQCNSKLSYIFCH